ncbi:hypothetical protein GH714_031940 [Hevea brasiliensis]|uniref:Protein kinase domain-containing protein n=1 Tax=Hevea brasiliensis TaxID=3981 RepID=A0A6A6KJW2_HEVBR|nr:hypothetical protein GH714_031940 [Hevea brasiliensis]
MKLISYNYRGLGNSLAVANLRRLVQSGYPFTCDNGRSGNGFAVERLDRGLMLQRQSLKVQLSEVSLREEIWWRQRAKIQWLNEGDWNTRYFHDVASKRHRVNHTGSLIDFDGRELWDIELHDHIVSFYSDLFTSTALEVGLDKWIPQLISFQVIMPQRILLIDPTVSSLINAEARMWDWDLISSIFLPVDVYRIRAIPLSTVPRPDALSIFDARKISFVTTAMLFEFSAVGKPCLENVAGTHQDAVFSRSFPPPFGLVKMNTDAGIIRSRVVSLGVVFRDDLGNVLTSANKFVVEDWDSYTSEALAIAFGLKLAVDLSFHSFIVETDYEVKIEKTLVTGTQRCQNYVSQSTVALQCKVMPPPCIKNPYLMDSWKVDIDLYELCDCSLPINKSSKSFTEDKVLEVLHQIAKALHFIHGRGIAHLDVKPDNIYVKNGVYKLGDFGCATLLNQSLLIEKGDVHYMPQEILNENYNHLDKVDILSLGAAIYELNRGSPLPK